jgi:hypothetical protein
LPCSQSTEDVNVMAAPACSAQQTLHSASDEHWAEAVRREGIIRLLAEGQVAGRGAVRVAARQLGLSVPRRYRLLREFRARPVTDALLLRRSGPARGFRRLAPAIESKVEAAIDAVYMLFERPTLKVLFSRVRHECRAAGIKPPSLTALRARVTARSLRERIKARDGAGAAGDGSFSSLVQWLSADEQDGLRASAAGWAPRLAHAVEVAVLRGRAERRRVAAVDDLVRQEAAWARQAAKWYVVEARRRIAARAARRTAAALQCRASSRSLAGLSGPV